MTLSSNDERIRAQLEQKNKRIRHVVIGGVAGVWIIAVIWAIVKFAPLLFTASDADLNSVQSADPTLSKEGAHTAQASTDKANTQAREAFKSLLVAFEAEVEPALQKAGLATWRGDRVDAVLQQKEQALVSFAKGAFVSAVSQLDQAKASAQALLADWQASFDERYLAAEAAFQQAKLGQAQLAIQEALTIMPSAENALALQQKIADYPQIQSLFDAWDVAVAERNVAKQIQAMQAIVALDPSQDAVQSALQKAIEAQKQAQFSDKVKQANQALDVQDLVQAKQAIKAAESLYAGHKVLAPVKARLQTLEKNQSSDALKQQVHQAKDADNWQQVAKLCEQGLALAGNDAFFSETLTLAQSLNSAAKKAHAFIAQPKRLTDDNVHQAATTFIQQNIALVTHSPAFAQQLQSLQQAMKDAKTPVSILVKSDNRTEIFVLGTGVIGKVSSKAVSLPQGDYVLEGRRKGYRNKQINVSLRVGEAQQTVTLVCDERI